MRYRDALFKQTDPEFTRLATSWFDAEARPTPAGLKAIQTRTDRIELEHRQRRRRARSKTASMFTLTTIILAVGIGIMLGSDEWGVLGLVPTAISLLNYVTIWKEVPRDRAKLAAARRASLTQLDAEIVWMQTWAATPERQRHRIQQGRAGVAAAMRTAKPLLQVVKVGLQLADVWPDDQ